MVQAYRLASPIVAAFVGSISKEAAASRALEAARKRLLRVGLVRADLNEVERAALLDFSQSWHSPAGSLPDVPSPTVDKVKWQVPLPPGVRIALVGSMRI